MGWAAGGGGGELGSFHDTLWRRKIHICTSSRLVFPTPPSERLSPHPHPLFLNSGLACLLHKERMLFKRSGDLP